MQTRENENGYREETNIRKGIVQVPNETAKAPQMYDDKKLNDKPISLEALGLLVNMWSYI